MSSSEIGGDEAVDVPFKSASSMSASMHESKLLSINCWNILRVAQINIIPALLNDKITINSKLHRKVNAIHSASFVLPAC